MKRSTGQEPLLDKSPDGVVITQEFRGENLFVGIGVLVRRVAYGRIPILQAADIPDIVQDVSLRLWKWCMKYGEKSERMTDTDWNSFTARTAHNEINRYYSNRKGLRDDVSLDEAASVPTSAPEGNTDVEMISLVNKVWQEICSLSVYQRRSLLLHSSDLIIHFMLSGIEEETIARTLEFDGEEWQQIIERLPLTDAEIAEIFLKSYVSGNRQPNAGAVKKARFDARKKLKGLEK